MSKKNRIRLYVQSPLKEGENISCFDDTHHYLINVMRRRLGDEVYVFNGQDGEFCSTICAINKKDCVLKLGKQVHLFSAAPDVWLLFAPLKKDNTDFVVAKAVELGVSKIVPVMTEYTSSDKIRLERLEAQAIEAAEQSRRQDVPEVAPLVALNSLLAAWPADRKLIYLDETGFGSTAAEVLPKCSAPAALLVGPEGGFSEKELEFLRNLEYTHGMSLGKRILRAETAAVAALACWQAFCGDWKN